MIKIIIILILSISLLLAAFYLGVQYNQKEIIIEKPVQNIVYREPAKMKRPEIEKELNLYYSSPFIINWNKKNNKVWKFKITLVERWVKGGVIMPVAESQGWKLNVALVGAGIVAGGYAAYKLRR